MEAILLMGFPFFFFFPPFLPVMVGYFDGMLYYMQFILVCLLSQFCEYIHTYIKTHSIYIYTHIY